jgi:hypothetical protein
MNGIERPSVPAPSNTLQTREIAKLAQRRTGSLCVAGEGAHNAELTISDLA